MLRSTLRSLGAAVAPLAPAGALLRARTAHAALCMPMRAVLAASAPAPLLPAAASIHTSSAALSRFPALQTRISRKAHARNQRKISQLKARLGDKYRIIGRDKRQSPLTERRSPSKPTQPPKPAPIPLRIGAFLASKTNVRPLDVTPGKMRDAIEAAKKFDEAAHAAAETEAAKAKSGSSGILMRTAKTVAKGVQSDETTVLRLPADAVPKLPEDVMSHIQAQAARHVAGRKAPMEVRLDAESVPVFEPSTAVGPYYRFCLTPSEVEAILSTTPSTLDREGKLGGGIEAEERAEMVRRILSLDNASEGAIRQFNVARSIEIFQRFPGDTGSPEVQAAVMTVRIQAIQKHLAANPKDKSTKRQLQKWVSRRERILKYLRRTNLAKFVETSRALGLDPQTIRA